MDLIFRPLEAWPGAMTPPAKRKRAPFRAGYAATLRLLDQELRMLRARAIVIQAALRAQDIRLDGMPKAGASPDHPGIILAFDSRFGPLSYPCDRFNHWHDNLRAIALSLRHLRAVDRYGVTRRGEQYTGWARLPPPIQPAMTPDQAKALLARYGGETEAIKATHPDRGGDTQEFVRVQEARRVLGLTKEG